MAGRLRKRQNTKEAVQELNSKEEDTHASQVKALAQEKPNTEGCKELRRRNQCDCIKKKCKEKQCKACRGGSTGRCEHGRQMAYCKDYGGSGICEHGRQRSRCKACGGSSICEHGRQRSRCKDCGGSGICEHGR
eukprot:356208-Hanusia_phi.AAC.1